MIEKQPTIYDLAESLNISVGTVYRALHNKGRISSETKERVLQKASEMNFKLNQTAQALSRTPKMIGVILCCPVLPFLEEIHAGISYEFDSLRQYNIFGDIHTLPPVNAEECAEQINDLLYLFISKKYDGIILFLSGSHQKCLPALQATQEADIPLVCLVNDIPISNRKAFVTADGNCAGRIAASLLSFSSSGQRVAILTGSSSIHSHRQSLSGFMSEAKLAPFESSDIYEHMDCPQLVEQQLVNIFSRRPSYGGLYIASASSITACPLLMELNKDKQITVITTDLYPQLKEPLESGVVTATIFQNPFLQGRKAVASMYKFLCGELQTVQVRIAPQIVMRSNIDQYHINQQSKADS